MPQLTVCLISPRDFTAAHPSIDQALAFAAARDALLVLADLAGDPQKAAYAQEKGEGRVRTLSGDTLSGALLAAAQAAETPFVFIATDGDRLSADPTAMPFDLEDLPFDHIGVLPMLEEVIGAGENPARLSIVLNQAAPGERLAAYAGALPPGHPGLHAIWRREPLIAALDLFHRMHPTRGAYALPALSLALIASAKMAEDRSIVYHRAADGWASAPDIEASRRQQFEAAGLPEQAARYRNLFRYLDLFILVNKAGSPLSIDERQRLGTDISNLFLGAFIRDVADNAEAYDSSIIDMAQMALEEADNFNRFQIGMVMADRAMPGLKDRYVAFVQAAVSGT
ncbi:hypothetical protein [Rhizobium paknamense]|uniref:Nucleotidyltransferase n=1 Tax=Rhizobium paknamense TaxID=1206817 RepID=A0ABU0I6E3_9HYPH|nr:hypothetical protein [Rhizobium paknamense]MDQ0453799.1 hypothetical protein [Rhizobium paknamense]